MGGLLGLGLGVVAIVFGLVLQAQRKARARDVLRLIDEGRMCIACNGTDMQVIRGSTKCNRCGHSVVLAGLRSAQLSEDDLNNATAPDNREF